MSNVDLSIVFPTLNEELTIGICIKKALKLFDILNLNGEILVSDGFSVDRTVEIAMSLGARVIYQDGKGYGNAYISGFKKAKGKILVMADADNTYDILELPKFIRPLQDNIADFVIGNRFRGTLQPGAMPWLCRYIGNPILGKILEILFRTGISDPHCGMRAFTKEAFIKMNPSCNGMAFASELVVRAKRSNLRILEVPINYYPRVGSSKLNPLRDGFQHLLYMLKARTDSFINLPISV
jgi:glycosyltransferase involved in cell wall biosynthesis